MKRLSALLLCLFVLAGCTMESAESLFALPRPPEDFVEVQKVIDETLAQGASYASPKSGPNRQPIQMVDLDNDGVDEAICFFKMSGEKPIKIYIYKKNSFNESFEVFQIVEEDAEAIESIYYPNLDNDDRREIVVGYQLGGLFKALSVYSVTPQTATELFCTEYSGYTVNDLTGDGIMDVVILEFDPSAQTGSVEIYGLSGETLDITGTAPLSNGIIQLLRLRNGQLLGGENAILVAGTYEENSIISDIFAVRDGVFVNITRDQESGISEETIRDYPMYGSDIDGDGVFDIPKSVRVPAFPDNPDEEQWVIPWYNYNIWGESYLRFATYQSNQDSWFLILPERWLGHLTITRRANERGETAVVFAYWLGEDIPPVEMLRVYNFSGDNRDVRAAFSERLAVLERSDSIVAAELLTLPPAYEDYQIGIGELRENLRQIQSEWITGELALS